MNGDRMTLGVVRFLGLAACVFTIVYGIHDLSKRRTTAMPATAAYGSVGLLGVCVGNVLKSQERRISQLEQMLSNRS